jgi:hypothetical protein
LKEELDAGHARDSADDAKVKIDRRKNDRYRIPDKVIPDDAEGSNAFAGDEINEACKRSQYSSD